MASACADVRFCAVPSSGVRFSGLSSTARGGPASAPSASLPALPQGAPRAAPNSIPFQPPRPQPREASSAAPTAANTPQTPRGITQPGASAQPAGAPHPGGGTGEAAATADQRSGSAPAVTAAAGLLGASSGDRGASSGGAAAALGGTSGIQFWAAEASHRPSASQTAVAAAAPQAKHVHELAAGDWPHEAPPPASTAEPRQPGTADERSAPGGAPADPTRTQSQAKPEAVGEPPMPTVLAPSISAVPAASSVLSAQSKQQPIAVQAEAPGRPDDSTSDSEEEGPAGGAAREARLRAAMKQLKARLELANAENLQLEELLKQADTRISGAISGFIFNKCMEFVIMLLSLIIIQMRTVAPTLRCKR